MVRRDRVCFLPIYSGRQACVDVPAGGHTGGRSHRISHPPSSCCACLYFYRGEKDLAIPFPRRPTVKSNVVYPRITINRSPLVGHDFYGTFYFLFFVRKNNSSSCDCTEIQTHVPTPEGFEVTN